MTDERGTIKEKTSSSFIAAALIVLKRYLSARITDIITNTTSAVRGS
jgi:hypothetical protein